MSPFEKACELLDEMEEKDSDQLTEQMEFDYDQVPELWREQPIEQQVLL